MSDPEAYTQKVPVEDIEPGDEVYDGTEWRPVGRVEMTKQLRLLYDIDDHIITTAPLKRVQRRTDTYAGDANE
jgi:hypothetical protein